MGNGFSALIDEIVRRPLNVVGKWRRNKTSNFIQYHMRYAGECLHYEMLDGCEGVGLKDDDQNLLYEKDVAYVELHFERRRGMSEIEKRRLKFFAERLSDVSAPFRFIPQWGGNGIGFALRYMATEEHLGGVPCPVGSAVGDVRDELERRVNEFITKLDPEIEKLSKLFDKEETNMAELNGWVAKLETAKQIILTGAPGTGKTYLARQIARSMVLNEEEKKLPEEEQEILVERRTKFVQFHPSYDYTDFVEGLRPFQNADGQVGFKRQDGEFKELCRAAIDAGQCGGVDNFEEVWQTFISMLDERYGKDNPLTITAETCVFKVYVNKRGNLSFITSGADNAQGSLTKDNIRKFYVDDSLKDPWRCYFTGVLSYLKDEKNGYHLKPYVTGKAVDPKDRQKFVMIIDEINRGDISKIFGELFYAIDDGYRGPRGRVRTQYQNLVDKKEVFGKGFYVPENVYIIGTMNDVDRNVESMDFAIRRRFTWEEIKPEDRFDAMMNGLKDSTGTEVSAEIITQTKKRMNGLNAAICDKKNGLGAAYQIGPSYFAKIKDYPGEAATKFEALWKHHLKPLLCEYLRGMPNADDTVDKVLLAAYEKGAEPQKENDQTTVDA